MEIGMRNLTPVWGVCERVCVFGRGSGGDIVLQRTRGQTDPGIPLCGVIDAEAFDLTAHRLVEACLSCVDDGVRNIGNGGRLGSVEPGRPS